MFPQCCNVRVIQRTLKKHFKGKDFLKSSCWKSCFCVKLYDLIITNVYFLANPSNHELMFPEYSRNIPQMPIISPEYCKVMKIFLEAKMFKKLFCGLFCENFDIGSPLSCDIFLNFNNNVVYLE